MAQTAARSGETVWRYVTLAPAAALYLLLTAVPAATLLALSISDIAWVEGSAQWSWAGLQHYAALGSDALFGVGVLNTLIFAVVAVIAELLLGFALALLTGHVRRGRVAYRAIFLLPVLVPGIVIGAMWKLMYNFDFGIINQLLAVFDIPAMDWLGSRSTALASVIVVDIWHWTPFCFLLLLAGLQSLPTDVYEAARIDGASRLQELRHITLPLMVPTILVTLIFRLIVALKVFDEVYLLTGGGPGTATEVVSFNIYRRFFTEDRPGYGAAMSVMVLFVLTMLIVLAMAAVRRRNRPA